MDDFMLLVLALSAILLLRNHLTYKFRIRRIDEIHARNSAAIDGGWLTSEMADEYKAGPSYEAQLFNPLIWTYSQFYPSPLYWGPATEQESSHA